MGTSSAATTSTYSPRLTSCAPRSAKRSSLVIRPLWLFRGLAVQGRTQGFSHIRRSNLLDQEMHPPMPGVLEPNVHPTRHRRHDAPRRAYDDLQSRFRLVCHVCLRGKGTNPTWPRRSIQLHLSLIHISEP